MVSLYLKVLQEDWKSYTHFEHCKAIPSRFKKCLMHSMISKEWKTEQNVYNCTINKRRV